MLLAAPTAWVVAVLPTVMGGSGDLGGHRPDGPGAYSGSGRHVDLAYSGGPDVRVRTDLDGYGSPGRKGDSGGPGGFGRSHVPDGQGCRDGRADRGGRAGRGGPGRPGPSICGNLVPDDPGGGTGFERPGDLSGP